MQKIIACNDPDLLKLIGELLQEMKANEPGEDYQLESYKSLLSNQQLEELERRSEAYKTGKEKAISWEDARKDIESKYGF
ncbi:MAG TPA: addiction module protein [Salegentibacter sp.]|nr:addiction module protein [Salegentibacter sp.]